MLKAAIEKVLELAKPMTVEAGKRTFLLIGNGDYERVPLEELAAPLEFGTRIKAYFQQNIPPELSDKVILIA